LSTVSPHIPHFDAIDNGESRGGLPRPATYFVMWLILLLTAANYVRLAVHRPIAQQDMPDFRAYYVAADALNQGQDPYDHQVLVELAGELGLGNVPKYLPSPLLAVVARPLARFSFYAATVVWTLLSNVAFAMAFLLGIVLLRGKLTFRKTVVLLFAAGSFTPVWRTMENGHVDAFTFLLLMFCLYWALGARDWRAGALLGVAALLNIYVGLLLFYFLFRRRWRVVLGGLATILVCAVVTVLNVGLPVHLGFVRYGLWQAFSGERATLPHNSSVAGLFARMFIPNEWVGHIWKAHWLAVGLAIIATLFVVWLFIRRLLRDVEDGESMKYEFALALILILVVSPVTLPHHMIWLVWPLLLLIDRYWARHFDGVAPLTLLAAYFLICFPAITPRFFWGPLSMLFSFKLLALGLLWVQVARILQIQSFEAMKLDPSLATLPITQPEPVDPEDERM